MRKQLEKYFESNFKSYLEVYENLVSINSFTANAQGVNENGRIISDAFSDLGFIPEYIPSINPAFGNHLVLTRRGNTDVSVGLITHIDTVFSKEEEEANNFSWRVEGDRVYGPGTSDVKGGTILILMVMNALHEFSKDLFDKVTWIILANAAEERLSNDFGEICRDKLKEQGLAALIFEAGYQTGNHFSLVRARKGMAIYTIEVEGRSAHAGNQHQFGANAIVQLAKTIQEIEDLTDYENDLTYNVGVATGGTVTNRVPSSASARGEMRTFSKEVFEQGLNNLLAINESAPLKSSADGYRCKFNIKIDQVNDPWPPNAGTEQLLSNWKATASTLGYIIDSEERGGLSDGNHIWNFIPTLDGLGPNGDNGHCSEQSSDGSKEQEYATLSSFIPKAVLNAMAIQRLITNK